MVSRLALVSSFVLAAAILTPSSARADEGHIAAFAGTTTFLADSSGVVQIDLDESVTLNPLPLSYHGDVELAGGHQLVSLIIRPVGGEVVVKAGLVRSDGRTFDTTMPFETTLDPGRYLVYVITDGPGAEVTVHLEDLEGEAQIPVDQPADVELDPLETTVDIKDSHFHHSAGDEGDLGANGGIAFQVVWLLGQNHVDTDSGSCRYEGGRPVGGYLPGCPLADSAFYGNIWYPFLGPFGAATYSYTTTLGPAHWALQHYLTSAAADPSLRGGGLGFWLSF